jgi:hypothetical protein
MKPLWPCNSPDLNAIKPCWIWMKKQTTKHGVASRVAQMKKDWIKCWKSSLNGRFKSGLREFLSIFKELLSVKVAMSIGKD